MIAPNAGIGMTACPTADPIAAIPASTLKAQAQSENSCFVIFSFL